MKSAKLFSCLLGVSLALSAPVALGQNAKKEVSYSNKEKAKQLAKEGAAAYDAGSYEKALKAFQEAYSLNPEPKYLPPLGQCYEHLNRPKEAVDAYNQFLAAAESDHPLRPEVEKRRATLSKKSQAEASAALASGEKALSAGEYQKALAFYQSAYALDPSPETIYQIGQCQFKLGQHQEAIESLRLFLAQAPETEPKRAIAQKQVEELQSPAAAPKEKQPASKTPKLLWGAAAASGALGAAAGVFALLPNNGDLADLEKLQSRASLQAKAALAADLFFVVALSAGVTGVILQKKSKKAEQAKLMATPAGVTLSVTY